MNVISMMHEIDVAPNPMVSEPSLPDLLLSTNDSAEFMRIRALDQLDSPLNRHVAGESQQQMNMLGHDDECMQFEAVFSAIAVERLQKKAHVSFDDEQFPAMVRRERHEVGSRRGDESSRLQKRTSAAGSRASFETLNWHEWNSCPSRWFFTPHCRFGNESFVYESTAEFEPVDVSVISPRPRKYNAAK
jgi:hypothetical protein